MEHYIRVLFIKWLLDDRGITQKQLAKASPFSLSKTKKLLSLNYKYTSTEALDSLESTITEMRPLWMN